jgi:hypothetical protein
MLAWILPTLIEEMATLLLGRREPSKYLLITLKLKPTPQNRIVSGLARVPGDGLVLAFPINGNEEIHFVNRPTDEHRAELVM